MNIALRHHHAAPTGVTIACYENAVLSFVDAEMEQLYQNTFSSTAAEHVGKSDTTAYVVSVGGKPVTLLLFRREKGRVKVLNSVIKISPQEIRQFSEYIFHRYDSVHLIVFESIQTELLSPHLLCQQLNASEDIVLVLPDTAETYLDSLGKSTRQKIKYNAGRIVRNFPDFHYQVYERTQIDDHLIDKIIALKTARMNDRNEICRIGDEQKKWIEKIAKSYGFVGTASIGGKLCAGVICTRVGQHYFMHIIAHDPEYDAYSLGILSCYRTICEAIARGGKEYHFLWGHGDWKYKLNGKCRDLDNITVYRSRMRYMLDSGAVLRKLISSYIRKLKRRSEMNDAAFLPRLIGKIQAVMSLVRRGIESNRKLGPRNG